MLIIGLFWKMIMSLCEILKTAVLFVMLSIVTILSSADSGDETQGKTAFRSPVYLIGPGDALKVFVWNNPEVSTSVTVRPDGLITTPLVEDLKASGLTSTILARRMEKRLSKYIKNPKVTITVTGFVGRYREQIRVIGQAATPSSLPYSENMTLLDVIIAVGGLTTYAAGNRATVIRTIDGKKKKIEVRLDDLIRDGDISANINMSPGDVLIIPESWF